MASRARNQRSASRRILRAASADPAWRFGFGAEHFLHYREWRTANSAGGFDPVYRTNPGSQHAARYTDYRPGLSCPVHRHPAADRMPPARLERGANDQEPGTRAAGGDCRTKHYQNRCDFNLVGTRGRHRQYPVRRAECQCQPNRRNILDRDGAPPERTSVHPVAIRATRYPGFHWNPLAAYLGCNTCEAIRNVELAAFASVHQRPSDGRGYLGGFGRRI